MYGLPHIQYTLTSGYRIYYNDGIAFNNSRIGQRKEGKSKLKGLLMKFKVQNLTTNFREKLKHNRIQNNPTSSVLDFLNQTSKS